MRVLFSACPAYGHILPMVPLVRAAQRNGHDVLFATGPDLLDVLHHRGIPAAPAGPTFKGMQAIRAQAYPGFDGLPGDERLRAGAVGLFGLPAVPRADDLEAIARRWRPDLVVHEVLDLGGALVGHRLGLPSVTHGFGPFYPYHPELLEVAAGAVGAPALARDLLEVAPYVDISPSVLNPDVPHPFANRVSLRPDAGEPGSAASLSALDGLRPERTVYLTLGTIFNRTEVLAEAVAAIRTLPVDLVVTTGPGVDPAALGPQPANVVVAPFLPQTQVLERSALLVSQCGAGGLFGALCHGLPQVALPQGADQFLNAEALERAGAGIVLQPQQFSPAALRDAVAEALGDPRYAADAQVVKAEIDAMPTADEVLDHLIENTGSAAGSMEQLGAA